MPHRRPVLLAQQGTPVPRGPMDQQVALAVQARLVRRVPQVIRETQVRHRPSLAPRVRQGTADPREARDHRERRGRLAQPERHPRSQGLLETRAIQDQQVLRAAWDRQGRRVTLAIRVRPAAWDPRAQLATQVRQVMQVPTARLVIQAPPAQLATRHRLLVLLEPRETAAIQARLVPQVLRQMPPARPARQDPRVQRVTKGSRARQATKATPAQRETKVSRVPPDPRGQAAPHQKSPVRPVEPVPAAATSRGQRDPPAQLSLTSLTILSFVSRRCSTENSLCSAGTSRRIAELHWRAARR